MKPGKYEPYRSSGSLKDREAKRRAKWFTYDPYTKEKVKAKPLDAYTPETPPLIPKESVREEIHPRYIAPKEKVKPLFLNTLLRLIQPFFNKISFGISRAAQTLLNKFKRHK